MKLRSPYLLFLGDAPDQLAAKVAAGVNHWRPDQVVGQFRLSGCQADLGVADLTLEAARDRGALTVVVGVANRGGVIADSWIETLSRALDLGFDVASGLHNKLTDAPALTDAAARNGRSLFDVRHPTESFSVGSGAPRPGRRALTVGTDCSCGKMYTSLAITAELTRRGVAADFRATGQTGIFIVGEGVSVDAVVADFISGAVEALAPAADPEHWDVIEGQGSLHHASFAGVTAGLIHGSQADALVLCHEPTRRSMRGLPHAALPDIGQAIGLNEEMARLTNPRARVVGLSINTAALSDADAATYLQEAAFKYRLPAVDPVRTGVGPIVDAMLAR